MYFLPFPSEFSPYGVDGRRQSAESSLENGRTARSEARTERPAFEAANSAFFDASETRRFFHQRRSSTADESGLPDSVE